MTNEPCSLVSRSIGNRHLLPIITTLPDYGHHRCDCCGTRPTAVAASNALETCNFLKNKSSAFCGVRDIAPCRGFRVVVLAVRKSLRALGGQ
jgi:hypothetical protein